MPEVWPICFSALFLGWLLGCLVTRYQMQPYLGLLTAAERKRIEDAVSERIRIWHLFAAMLLNSLGPGLVIMVMVLTNSSFTHTVAAVSWIIAMVPLAWIHVRHSNKVLGEELERIKEGRLYEPAMRR